MNQVLTLLLMLSGLAFGSDPNIISRQFWGIMDPNYPFIVIEELTPKVYRYVSVEPNLAPSWEFTVDKARTYRLNSIAALHYVSVKCPTLAYVNTLSRYWRPVKAVTVVVVPIKDADVQVDANDLMVCIIADSPVYHVPDLSCRYVRGKTNYRLINVIDAMNEGKRPCKGCKPLFYSDEVVDANVVEGEPNAI